MLLFWFGGFLLFVAATSGSQSPVFPSLQKASWWRHERNRFLTEINEVVVLQGERKKVSLHQEGVNRVLNNILITCTVVCRSHPLSNLHPTAIPPLQLFYSYSVSMWHKRGEADGPRVAPMMYGGHAGSVRMEKVLLVWEGSIQS